MRRSILAASVVVATACAVGAVATVNNHPSPLPPQSASLPASCTYRGSLPDPTCTPGATDPRVTQANIQSTICLKGYTATIRPPVSYTNPLKARLEVAYGYSGPAELDHLIPLELGGAPSDPKNLWPEPGAIPNPKDRVENAAHAAACSGRITLAHAQQAIATDWTALGRELGV